MKGKLDTAMQFIDSFRAMNTDIDTIVVAESPMAWLTISARLLFDQQEERFSRFRPTSLVSRLNAGETISDPWLGTACRMAIEAYEFTGGLFNPMVLQALVDAGYGSTFEEVSGGAPQAQGVPDPREALVMTGDSVRLREGRLDLGGIVKGWTADLAAEVLSEDCPDVLVNAGGDARCFGTDHEGDGWYMIVEAPGTEEAIWEGRLSGAIATSTTRKRRWTTAGGAEAHHLIDPRTGMPAISPFIQVSALAGQAWIAECWAKAVLIGGTPAVAAATAAEIDLVTLSEDGESRFVKGFP